MTDIMHLSVRKIVEAVLPHFLSKQVIAFGESYKRVRRDKRRYSYGKGKPFIKDIHVEGVSFKIMLDPVRNSGVDDDIAKNGYWEKELSAQIKKNLPEGGVFLDIGANIGYHSLFAAASLQGSGKVYSFEPLPHLCTQLKESISVNGFTNIEVCNFGLAESKGEHVIYIRDENTGGSSLLDLQGIRVKGTQKITVKELDSFFGDQKVDAIKIDVEGYEYEALKGGREVLEKNHPLIFMEFSPVFYVQDHVQKPYDLIHFLMDLGYSFSSLAGQPLDLNNWLKEGDNLNSQIDIICRAS